MATKEQANEAFETLAQYGANWYKPGCAPAMTKWQKVGKALSSMSDYGRDFAQCAFEALEEWNFHPQCAVLDWIFHLHPISKADIERIKALVERTNAEYTDWDNENQTWVTRHARVTVNVEWLD